MVSDCKNPMSDSERRGKHFRRGGKESDRGRKERGEEKDSSERLVKLLLRQRLKITSV